MIALFLGAVLVLVGVWVLVGFWGVVKRRGAVKRIRADGPRDARGAKVGEVLWALGVVGSKRVQTHPFDGSACVYWSVKVTHLVREKISNDAGTEERRRTLYRDSAGEEAIVEFEGGRIVVELGECDRRTLESDKYKAKNLPEPVRGWLRKHKVDLDAKGLKLQVYYLPVDAEVSVLGRVLSIDKGVVRLDDAGPTGLALSVDGLDEYIDSLAEGLLLTFLAGVGFVIGGFLLVGRFFFG